MTLTQVGGMKSRSFLTTVHGLLTVRRGGQFSKRVRRVATLEEGLLSFRVCEGCKPERTLCILGAIVVGDVSNFSITITSDTYFTSSSPVVKMSLSVKRQHRVRLYAHSRHKFTLWLSALLQAASATVFKFYSLAGDPATHHADIPILVNRSLASAMVSVATDRSTGMAVAVKTVPLTGRPGQNCVTPPSVLRPESVATLPHGTLQAYACAQARRELGVCRHVHHPCVIGVHDVFVSPDVMHVVTDLPSHNVQCLVNCHGALPERVVARIAYDVLRALEYLHGENIVHRSIVPKNICLPLTLSTSVLKLPEEILGNHVQAPSGDDVVARIADFSTAAFAPRRALPGAAYGGGLKGDKVYDGSGGGGNVCSRTVVRSTGLCDVCGVSSRTETDFDTIKLFGFAHVDSDSDDDNDAQQHQQQQQQQCQERVSVKNIEDDCYKSRNLRPLLRFGSIDRQTLTDCIGGGLFTAPEIRSTRLHGPAADMWSMGILIYYMLTGSMPSQCVLSPCDIVIHSCIEFDRLFESKEWNCVSNGAKNFVAALLKLNPRSRLTAEAALRNEWLNNVALDNSSCVTID